MFFIFVLIIYHCAVSRAIEFTDFGINKDSSHVSKIVFDQVVPLILELKTRVEILEETRADNSNSIRDLQIEINKLKLENKILQNEMTRLSEMKLTGKPTYDKLIEPNSARKVPTKFKQVNESSLFQNTKNEGAINNQREEATEITKQPNKELPKESSPRIIRTGGYTGAFYATVGHNILIAPYPQALVFDYLKTSISGEYSSNTGVFSCQQSGVYVFFWTVVVGDRDYCSSFLRKNGETIASTVSGDDSGYFGSGSGTVVVQVNRGDEVWVLIGGHSSNAVIHSQYTMFSGFKLL